MSWTDEEREAYLHKRRLEELARLEGHLPYHRSVAATISAAIPAVQAILDAAAGAIVSLSGYDLNQLVDTASSVLGRLTAEERRFANAGDVMALRIGKLREDTRSTSGGEFGEFSPRAPVVPQPQNREETPAP